MPDTLPQLVSVDRPEGKKNGKPRTFVWIEQVIQANLGTLFPGMEVLDSHLFHVTRDADFAIQELEAADLLETVEEGVRQRRFGEVVRLKVNAGMPDSVLSILKQNLEVEELDIYRIDGPLALSRLRHLAGLDRSELKDQPFTPSAPEGWSEEEDIFSLIRRGDILLHHPFDCFQPVVDFLKAAARDPNVLAIKMTLYRVGRNSPVVEALLEAIEYGKQVAVLVELKARFDEESNIEWARALEREGVHVVYGLVGLKMHCKVALVVRREGRRHPPLRPPGHRQLQRRHRPPLHRPRAFHGRPRNRRRRDRPVQLPHRLLEPKPTTASCWSRPSTLRQRLEALIEREIEHARAGREARIIFKMNALVDARIIRLLYQASQAGREGRSARARHLLPASGRPRRQREHPRHAASWAGSWSTAASSTSATAATKRCFWAPPT